MPPVLFFSLGSLCCSALLYIIMSTSQENIKGLEQAYTTYTVRFPESLGNKERFGMPVLTVFIVYTHYEVLKESNHLTKVLY